MTCKGALKVVTIVIYLNFLLGHDFLVLGELSKLCLGLSHVLSGGGGSGQQGSDCKDGFHFGWCVMVDRMERRCCCCLMASVDSTR